MDARARNICDSLQILKAQNINKVKPSIFEDSISGKKGEVQTPISAIMSEMGGAYPTIDFLKNIVYSAHYGNYFKDYDPRTTPKWEEHIEKKK